MKLRFFHTKERYDFNPTGWDSYASPLPTKEEWKDYPITWLYNLLNKHDSRSEG